jgi:hypothetical protein
VTATEDRKLRQVMRETLRSLPPSPPPVEAIVRRGQRIRLRRAVAAVGGLALAGIIAVTSAALRGSPQPTVPAAGPTITAGPDGVFADGIADGRAWRLAVQDIADPGYRCLPAIVLNGTDADPVYPAPGNPGGIGGAVALGRAVPGVGFGFVQVPADSSGITVDGGKQLPPVTVTVCGYHYRLVGFAYSMTKVLQVRIAHSAGLPAVVTAPFVSSQAPASFTSAYGAGQWVNTSYGGGPAASGVLASGHLSGQDWTIQLQFGTGGDCYSFSAAGSLGSTQMGSCGPVSTPGGPETIMALPLGFADSTGATGYAVQVSPGTARLKAVFSNGSVTLATPRMVDGRKYVAFVVPSPLTLRRLVWLDAAGRVIASTAGLPRYGYVQVQP